MKDKERKALSVDIARMKFGNGEKCYGKLKKFGNENSKDIEEIYITLE